MRNLAIIPARSGSKGLPNKNIKLLGDKPLIAYSIDAANKSKLFDEVMVSTDSEEYAQVARRCGASVPFMRSMQTSNDQASSWDVVKEVLAEYGKLGKNFDTVSLLQPTSPLRIAEDIVNGYQLFSEKNAEAVVAVCEMDHSPLWSNTIPNDLCMNGFIRDEVKNRNRQGLPTYYRINGALYIIRTELLSHIEELYGESSFAFVMPRERSIDIDTEIDFIMAQSVLSSYDKND